MIEKNIMYALLLIFLIFAIYGVYSALYQKYVLHYDTQKVYNVCTHPSFYPCEDLLYASPYCRSALQQYDNIKCNVTLYAFANH